MAILKNTTVNDTGNLKIPVGTTGQRPSPTSGQFRYNTTTNKVEIYTTGPNIWQSTTSRGVIASGGTIYDIDSEGTTYRVHVFTNTGSSPFTVSRPGNIEYLIVAGGGQGGGNCNSCGGAGAGGAGGLITGVIAVTPQTYTITVGAGGSGGIGNTNSTDGNGGSGGNSSAFGLLAVGGGGGRPQNAQAGGTGGSGGGGSGGGSPAPGAGGAGTAGQGFAGGAGTNDPCCPGGGGGGAGGIGESAGVVGRGGNGGNGIASSITGTTTIYAGGGGGGGDFSVVPGTGGLGGGGSGANQNINSGNGFPGTPNAGGGGGAASGRPLGANGGLGGSGIVVIRYPLYLEPDVIVPKIIKDGLVLDLDFANSSVYPGSGTVVNDSRLGVSANTVGAFSFADSRTHRSSFRFTGSTQYIQLPATLERQLNGRPEASLNMWIRLNSGSNGAENSGIIQLSNFNDGNGNLYYYTQSGTVGGIWLDIFRTNRVATGDWQPTVNATNWHLLTVTTTPGTNGWKMYLNGTLRFQTTGQDTVSVNSSLFGGFRVGQNSNGRQLLGNIGKVSIYNTALSASQVSDYFSITRWRFGV
jgi:hypothetical protein